MLDNKRKRHDLAIEQLQKAQVEWRSSMILYVGVQKQERINFISKQLRLERKVEANFEELNDAMREYHKVFSNQLLLLPRETVLSDLYTLSNEQHDRELVFIPLSMVGIEESCGTWKAECHFHDGNYVSYL